VSGYQRTPFHVQTWNSTSDLGVWGGIGIKCLDGNIILRFRCQHTVNMNADADTVQRAKRVVLEEMQKQIQEQLAKEILGG
jgi:hypothetical protein